MLKTQWSATSIFEYKADQKTRVDRTSQKKKRRKKAEEKITKEKKVTRDFCETSTLIQLHFDSENEIRSKAR